MLKNYQYTELESIKSTQVTNANTNPYERDVIIEHILTISTISTIRP